MNKEYLCEWCYPEVAMIAAKAKPEKYRILFCNKCKCKSWHGPRPIGVKLPELKQF